MCDRSDYAASLMRHLGTCVVMIMLTGAASGWCMADIVRFSETGQSSVPPGLVIFFCACFSLLCVAMAAVYRVQGEVRRLVASSDRGTEGA